MATEEELKRAYKAFKKRLKLARLDDESGLSPGSKRSGIAGITPPAGHPPGIWEELVAQGSSGARWAGPTRWSPAGPRDRARASGDGRFRAAHRRWRRS